MGERRLPRLVIHQAMEGKSGLLVRLSGELDVDTAEDLREVVASLAVEPANRRLVLDLSDIIYCDDASLYTLLGICQALDLIGIEVVLVKINSAVRAVMHCTDLEERLSRGMGLPS